MVIKVENLGKRYRIGANGAGSEGLRHAIHDLFTNPLRRARNGHSNANPQSAIRTPQSEEFWALKDVSFEVKQGEVVGIIGRNGAGKSTLLKILSRITEPTTGRLGIRGRVASLLEVGTGFHPELTGRENVFLNGAILGMTREEIKRKFDEIVAFAEIEKFIDTPVKRYSSGMYVRLAFAVAAHLEPEILIVDEVLAVGDAQFQKKCLGKLGEVGKQGRTVLLVSHNVGAIQGLCKRALVMDEGTIVCDSDVFSAVSAYIGTVTEQTEVHLKPRATEPSITCVTVNPGALAKGDLVVDIAYKSPFPLAPPVGGVVLSTMTGVPVFGSNPRFHATTSPVVGSSEGVVRMRVSQVPLFTGRYKLSVWLGDWHRDYDQRLDLLSFSFKPTNLPSLRPSSEVIGYLDWPAEWTIKGTT